MERKPKREGLTSVQIRSEITRKLARLLRSGMTKSQIINEALRQYLIEKEFQEVRARLTPVAQAKGLYTDEDIERALR